MAFRIGEYVVRGELSNVLRNSVTGWLELNDGPEDEECGLKIELTGNLKGPFEGRHIRYRIDESLQFPDRSTHGPDRDSQAGRRSWDDVIPGLDEETKRMYEQWDEVAYGEKDEPLSTLFDPPLKLEPPDRVTSEEQAESLLNMLLTRLATHSVAVDVCEHFTALDTYRWLVEVILPEADIHPQLPQIGFVQPYSTWEDCPRCAAEFETGAP